MNDAFTVEESSERARVVKAPGGADDRPSFDPHHAIIATRLDYLGVECRGANTNG